MITKCPQPNANSYLATLLLINLLHLGGLISSPFHFLKWRQVVIISKSFVIIINAQAKLDPGGAGMWWSKTWKGKC